MTSLNFLIKNLKLIRGVAARNKMKMRCSAVRNRDGLEIFKIK
jgi:hypothetical protein